MALILSRIVALPYYQTESGFLQAGHEGMHDLGVGKGPSMRALGFVSPDIQRNLATVVRVVHR
ncbi:hypothetical protein ACIQUB_28915 [Rhizobium sp. NPDC090275]|uniref:hypothetical protein n=1 Tax=Rhizobium sp. NPDC090275 TaxID=3364498 RepID=UPI003839EAAB